MKYSIIDGILYEDGQCSNIQASFAEEEFWARIKELGIALTEIATRVRRVPFRLGGAAQIVLSAEQMAEIAEKALRSPQRL